MLEKQREAMMSSETIRNLIYMVREKQVMLDSDLATIYQVETKRLNEAVKRNITRFPDEFRFQLTEEEYSSLRSQVATSKEYMDHVGDKGGRRYLPYVFTEQGIAMLSAVLRSEVAIQVSIKIMKEFVDMRRFLTNNILLFEHINEIRIKQAEYKKEIDNKFDEVFHYISIQKELGQKVFFEGQIYDAFSLFVDLVSSANKTIILIDNYVDIGTLNILTKKKENVSVYIYTSNHTKLTGNDIENFNKQYPILSLKYTKVFHDRFLILDRDRVYHIGASLKDAGKRCFAISLLEDNSIMNDIFQRLEFEEISS